MWKGTAGISSPQYLFTSTTSGFHVDSISPPVLGLMPEKATTIVAIIIGQNLVAEAGKLPLGLEF